MIDLVYQKDTSYFPQVFSEDCKYVFKEKKKSNFITADIEISSGNSDEENSDEKN